LELLGTARSGALVYDDYSHNPTKVAAAIAGARTLEPIRLVAVFQPHLYSRTRAMAREFGVALAGADSIIVLPIYPARENAADFPGVDGYLIAADAADAAEGRPVAWMPGFEPARSLLDAELRGGDICLVMGAGDVDSLARSLVV
jgi:UDP-N-acetylmuramate--alanine ligase